MKIKIILIALCISTISGCSVGKKSILFSTKTSLGVDVDSKPPTLDVGYDRKEGTLSPVYPGGEVLPQMASFSTVSGLTQVTASSSFATGNAATVLARYFTDLETGPNREDIINVDEMSVATIEGAKDPKRYFFGTDTSFGVKINFGVETAGMPDGLSVGFKRKELAFVPIRTTEDHKATLPSLIGTSGLGVDARNPNDGGVGYTQFYATGKPATYLAASPEIRRTLGIRILNDEQVYKELSQIESANKNTEIRKGKSALLLESISNEIDRLSDDRLDLAAQRAADSDLIRQADVEQFQYKTDQNGDFQVDLSGNKIHLDPATQRNYLKALGQGLDSPVQLEQLEVWESKLKAIQN